MAKKGINVKVKTVKVIDALEAVLKQRKKDHELYEKDCEAYKKATENADKKVLAFIKTGKATVKEVSSTNRWRSDNDKGFHAFTVTVLIAESVIGVKAEAPQDPHSSCRGNEYTDYETGNKELENAIRMLKMTDEEVVSTSTYSAVSRYL